MQCGYIKASFILNNIIDSDSMNTMSSMVNNNMHKMCINNVYISKGLNRAGQW